MQLKRTTLLITLLLLLVLFTSPILAQQDVEVVSEAASKRNGFFVTFVRTPFVLFCFVGTILGVIFSAFFEFIYNIFCGFDCGYPNTSTIWNLGWNEILNDWYWKPGVWWHVAISVIVWSPLLKRGKKDE